MMMLSSAQSSLLMDARYVTAAHAKQWPSRATLV
jgi:hypothetical protein